jgi:hypothetical protein
VLINKGFGNTIGRAFLPARKATVSSITACIRVITILTLGFPFRFSVDARFPAGSRLPLEIKNAAAANNTIKPIPSAIHFRAMAFS